VATMMIPKETKYIVHLAKESFTKSASRSTRIIDQLKENGFVQLANPKKKRTKSTVSVKKMSKMEKT
jgi:hypothetical protein